MDELKCRIVLLEDQWARAVILVIMEVEVEMDKGIILEMEIGTLQHLRGKLKSLNLAIPPMISQSYDVITATTKAILPMLVQNQEPEEVHFISKLFF